MPSSTPRQRRLFGIALSIKRKKTRASYSPAARRIAERVSTRKIREFAKR